MCGLSFYIRVVGLRFIEFLLFIFIDVSRETKTGRVKPAFVVLSIYFRSLADRR